MNPEPRLENGSEDVCFDADIHGNPVKIAVGREAIEDHLRAESMTVEFVTRNRPQIIEHVKAYLRVAPDVTGLHLGAEQLKHCR